MTNACRPRFVERPGDPLWPPPYEFAGVRLRCYWLTADPDRVAALCRAHFDDPTGGAVRVRPVGAGVALMFAHIGSVRAPHVAPPTVTEEREAGFWVPVHVEQPGVAPPRLAWWLPQLFVDEPNALVIGREGSGFPKTLADAVVLPWAAGARDTAHVTARVRDPASPAGRLAPRTVIEVAPSAACAGDATSRLDALGAGARAAASLPVLLAELSGGRLATLRMHVENVVARREVPLVLLRQLRALDDPSRAAHQEVVWVDNRLTRLGAARVLGAGYEVQLADASALPVAAALGLRAGRTPVDATLEAELDFALPRQSALWTAPARTFATGSPSSPRAVAPSRRRTRVAVLGGGIAGLATAWRLVTAPGGAERFEVTVYEKDHRLGGKCASGRDEGHGQRILEHGLHMWFGCYEESFRLLRELYAARPGDARDWREAFEPQSVFEFWDARGDGAWSAWRLAFPRNALVPGDGGPLADGPALVRSLGRWLATALEMALVPVATRTDPASAAAALARNLMRTGAALLGRLTRGLAADGASGARTQRAARVIDAVHARLRALGDAWLARDDEARQLYVTVDLGLAALHGVVADALLTRGFASVDGEDLRAWLARHGAARRSLDAAPVRALYDMTFAYAGGDRARPALAAGTGLHAILRMLFAYSGAVAWKMRGSMGDVVCAPLYEALARRGVRFEFFHEAVELSPAPGDDAIASVELRRVAEPRAGAYDPLVEVGSARCWPERARAEQLVPCDARVHLARGRDFDHVVLALPPAVLARVAAPLAAQRPAWRAMLAGLGSVATAAAQVWFARPLDALRPTATARGALRGVNEPVVLAGFAGPWDTWAEMTHTLASEQWTGPSAPRAVVYGCGPVTDAVAAQCDTPEARAAMLAGYLDAHGPALWPGATTRVSGARASRFDRSALFAGEAGPDGAIAAQYVRVNAHGSERYVQSLPGSTALRLAPDGSGYANLWLAGDWTRTGFDIGSVEAAVRSAGLAARALASRDGSIEHDAAPVDLPHERPRVPPARDAIPAEPLQAQT